MKLNKSSTIAGGVGVNKRNESDYYYTPKEATIALLDFIRLPDFSQILEPACGEGHICEVLISRGHRVIPIDIRNTGYVNGGTDYLKTPFSVDVIITNPPFNLAYQFIQKALTEATIVAMLLKSHYWHSKRRYELFKLRPPKYVLPLTWRPAMSEDRGNSPTMDFQWTVWDTRSYVTDECKYIPLLKPSPPKQQ